MSNRNYTYEILKEECVGDSLGKHNFNLLSLDTAICNLSSLFLREDDGNVPLWNTFYDLSVNRASYDLSLGLMLDTYRFDRFSFATSYLSSYWMKQELTIQYQFNKSTLPLVIGGLSAIPDIYVDPLFNSSAFNNSLISNTLNYLNSTYITSNFNDNTIMNVMIPVYTNDGSLIKSYNYQVSGTTPNTFRTITTNDLPSFDQIANTAYPNEFRRMTAQFKKEDNNILGNPIVRFIKNQNQWKLVTQVFPNTIAILSAVAPATVSPQTITSEISAVGNVVTARGLIVTEGPCTPISWNQLYSCDVYFSGEAIAYGEINSIGSKLGSISVVFVDSNGTQSQPYSYRAVNAPNTYLRWDNNFITAYEGYDNEVKQVMFRWENPYQDQPNIKFKFVKDDQAVTYSVCGSRKIIDTQ